jgi:hypothetical protein
LLSQLFSRQNFLLRKNSFFKDTNKKIGGKIIDLAKKVRPISIKKKAKSPHITVKIPHQPIPNYTRQLHHNAFHNWASSLRNKSNLVLAK